MSRWLEVAAVGVKLQFKAKIEPFCRRSWPAVCLNNAIKAVSLSRRRAYTVSIRWLKMAAGGRW